MQSDEEREFFSPSFWGKEKKIGFCLGLGRLLPLLAYLQQSLELHALPDRLEIRVIEEGTLSPPVSPFQSFVEDLKPSFWIPQAAEKAGEPKANFALLLWEALFGRERSLEGLAIAALAV
jgi:hypothetical protein